MESTRIFEKDARVAFIGDSITHSGLYVAEYHTLSEALYATSSEDSAAAREVLRI